jgi:hypothetical protein
VILLKVYVCCSNKGSSVITPYLTNNKELTNRILPPIEWKITVYYNCTYYVSKTIASFK